MEVDSRPSAWPRADRAKRPDGGLHAAMLQFPARSGVRVHPQATAHSNRRRRSSTPESPSSEGIHHMSTILVTGASGFVGSYTVPALLADGHRIVALVRTPDAGELVLGRLPAVDRERVECRIGDVTRPAIAGRSPRWCRCRPPPRGHPARSRRWRSAAAGQHRRDPRGRRRHGSRRRAAPGLHERDGRRRTTRPSTTRARRRRPKPLVTASSLDWTILKPSLQFGPGDGFFNVIADLVRMSPGIVPVPGDGKSRFQVIASRTSRRSWRGRSRMTARSGRPWTWAVRATGRIARSPARSSPPWTASAPSCRCRSSSSDSSRARPRRIGLPFPVATDQLRQLKLDNIGPLDVIPTRFGFEPAADGRRARLPDGETARPDGAKPVTLDQEPSQPDRPGRPAARRSGRSCG